MLRPRLAFLALAALTTPLAADPSAPLRPPVARKDPHKIEIHGDTLVDDYYWMRNKGTPEVESHLRAELAYSDAFMKPTAALQQKLYDEMLARIQQTDTNVPARERGFFYYSRTEEGKQYPIHARGGDPRRERARRRQEVHVHRRHGGQPRRQPPRLHRR